MQPLQTYEQQDRHKSPRPFAERFVCLLWQICWLTLCSWTPRPFNSWRLLWLKLFGCNVLGKAFVHQSARIHIPWHLTMHPESCIGDRAEIYNLAPVELGRRCVVAQQAYLCTGTHDFSDPEKLPLQCAAISIGEEAFVGARAFVLPGVTIGPAAIIGACAVVTRDVNPLDIVGGNPARVIGKRQMTRSY